MSVASSCAIHDFPKPGSHVMQPWENSKRTRQNWISASGWCETFRNRHLQYFLKGYQQKGFRIRRASLVVGSQIDPAKIANPHIRAHALEGQLFRSAMEQTLQDHKVRTDVLLERDAYPSVAARLRQSSNDVKRTIQDLGRSAPAKRGPWRAEQKLAAVAALFALG